MPRTGYLEPTGSMSAPIIPEPRNAPVLREKVRNLPENVQQGAVQRSHQQAQEVSTETSFQAVREANLRQEQEAMAAAEQTAREKAAAQSAAVADTSAPIQRATQGAEDPSLSQFHGQTAPEEEAGYVIDTMA